MQQQSNDQKSPCIYAGFLYKKGKVVKNMKKRWFTLDEHALSYFKGAQAATVFTESKSPRSKNEPIDVIPLSSIVSVEYTDQVLQFEGVDHYEFQVETKNRTYHLYANGTAIRQDWVVALLDILQEKFGLTQKPYY